MWLWHHWSRVQPTDCWEMLSPSPQWPWTGWRDRAWLNRWMSTGQWHAVAEQTVLGYRKLKRKDRWVCSFLSLHLTQESDWFTRPVTLVIEIGSIQCVTVCQLNPNYSEVHGEALIPRSQIYNRKNQKEHLISLFILQHNDSSVP